MKFPVFWRGLRGVFLSVFILVLVMPAWAFAESQGHPKYASQATPISISHEYFRKADAPDYWAISPYYAAQETGAACGVASIAMIANAARVGQKLSAEDPLITQKLLLKKTGEPEWAKLTGFDGALGVRGTTLEQLQVFSKKAFHALGFSKAKVELYYAEKTPEFLKKLKAHLAENEKSARNFIVSNFIQGALTGDANVGHLAPLGAYDARTGRVLVMDPDREWYEPYWVSVEVLLDGMSTHDSASGKNRGYLFIRLE